MQIYSSLVVLLTIIVQVFGVRRITLDDDSQALCKKYKMMCKADKICAVQHFDWPSNITIPVCIPLSFVPVRNMICKLPPDTGRCLARYIRWYYNIHSQECTHFQYGGCEGNQNNFMSKTECEQTCVSTPSIRLYEGGHSALVQPSIITAPVYESPKSNSRVEALNSVREQPSGSYDRYEVVRRRPPKRADESSNNRTRRHQEREKERKRREKKKEKKRLKKLRREQRKLRCKKRRERGKKCKKDRKSSKKRKSNKKKPIDRKDDTENMVETLDNEIEKVKSDDVMAEAKNIINSEIEAAEEDVDTDKNKKKDKGRKKRKLRDKRRNEKERNRRNLNNRKSRRYSEYTRKSDAYSQRLFSILDPQRQYQQQESSLLHTLT
ncbi:hypothetical protein ACF0H5_011809 [Mactra antiquata]